VTERFLSVDLGGTSLRMARFDGDAKLLESETIASARVRNPERLAEEIRALALKLSSNEKSAISGLALGIPGLVDSRTGIVHRSPHFPEWRDVPLADQLQRDFSFPVSMDNDANQAALGESWKGAGRHWKDFFLITLGTGIGGGIILDGNIYRGPSGFAGELGHIVIDRGGHSGALGSAGTLETLASQSGLCASLQRLQKYSKNLSPSLSACGAQASDLPRQLYDLAKSGDPDARAIWEDLGNALGAGIASTAHTLGIFKCVIGGGLSGAWEFFGDASLRTARSCSYDYTAAELEIVPAELGDQAGLIGGVKRLKADSTGTI